MAGEGVAAEGAGQLEDRRRTAEAEGNRVAAAQAWGRGDSVPLSESIWVASLGFAKLKLPATALDRGPGGIEHRFDGGVDRQADMV